jgi:hypothetical protein
MITTRRNIINYYIKPNFNIVMMGSVLIFIFYIDLTEGIEINSLKDIKIVFLIIAVLSFFYYSIISLFQIIKYAPIITIIDNQLFYGDDTYLINDIIDIKFTGKISIPVNGIKSRELNNKEGSIIKMKDGTELYLFDHFYDEPYLFKSFLREKLYPLNHIEAENSKIDIENKSYGNSVFAISEKINTPQLIEEGNSNITIAKKAPNNSPFTSTEKEIPIINLPNKVFRDSQFKRIRGVLIWLIPGYLITKNLIIYPNSININGKIVIIAVSLLLIYYHSRYMNYFVLEKDDLLIRNEIFFWKKEQIELSDIFEIVIEKEYRYKYNILNKKYLRIIYKDFYIDKYCADLLYEGTWENLKKEFEKINIPVRVEI